MKNPIIRTIYLYLFALIGLGMLVIGASMIINLGLKTWIFTKADMQDNYMSRPAPMYLKDPDLQSVEELEVCAEKCELTVMQKEQINNWLVDYNEWQNTEKNQDPNEFIIRNRQRQASTAVSLILIGLPLWLFHWVTIKKDVRSKKENYEKQ
ncbi:hypothetical protein KKC16_02930 [Patescibacteria group bacterium]|nr:hypothetical protein [Patescibacteria group bacterium]